MGLKTSKAKPISGAYANNLGTSVIPYVFNSQ